MNKVIINKYIIKMVSWINILVFKKIINYIAYVKRNMLKVKKCCVKN